MPVSEPAPDGKECSFDQKVRNAQAAGAAAAVVYDSVEEPLIRMMSETGGEGITIPAVRDVACLRAYCILDRATGIFSIGSTQPTHIQT